MRRIEGGSDRFDRRLAVGVGLASLSLALLALRLVQLQVLEFRPLHRAADRQQERSQVLQAARGAVTDREGNPFAMTVPEDRRGTHEEERLYVKGSLAAQVVGFTSRDGRGQEGIELAYDRDLKGVDGHRTLGASARGRLRTMPGSRTEAPQDGATIVLTIDSRAQSVLERELARTVEATGARSATGVFLDPETGDVVAMASSPSFDPARPGSFSAANRRLRAVTDMMEPGSTFKAFTVAACLEEGLVEGETMVESSLRLQLAGGHVMNDKQDYGWVTVEEILVHSVNTATAQLGRKLGAERMFEYARAFGFGCVTGIDLPGEVSGILRRPANWSGRSLETVAIGQEIGVTPLQLAAAYGAIANRGVLMKPRIVRELQEPGGRTIRAVRPRKVRRVMSASTARDLSAMLAKVVEEGTGETARIPGVSVAGKTGTAQWFDPKTGRYDPSSHISSFAGFVPAEDPRLVGVVIVERPSGVGWGREVAAPCFRRVVEGILLSDREPGELLLASGPGSD